jgi:hypothetical protein
MLYLTVGGHDLPWRKTMEDHQTSIQKLRKAFEVRRKGLQAELR